MSIAEEINPLCLGSPSSSYAAYCVASFPGSSFCPFMQEMMSVNTQSSKGCSTVVKGDLKRFHQRLRSMFITNVASIHMLNSVSICLWKLILYHRAVFAGPKSITGTFLI